MARAGGLGELCGLNLGHWASSVHRGRPPFSLWSSLTAVASKAPSHRPSRVPCVLSSSGPGPHRRVVRAGWVSCFPPLQQGQRGS